MISHKNKIKTASLAISYLLDHLLLHCEFSYQLWSLVFYLFGLSWSMPRRAVDMLAGAVCRLFFNQ